MAEGKDVVLVGKLSLNRCQRLNLPIPCRQPLPSRIVGGGLGALRMFCSQESPFMWILIDNKQKC